LSIEYDGWWIVSGVPSARRIVAPSRVRCAGVGGDPDVQRLALAHGRIERAQRLVEGRVGVEPVRIEDVDVVETESPKTLVEAGQEIFTRSAVAIRPWPHVVAGLRGDDQFVAIRAQVGG
jgi:hypothetical protein